VLVWAIYDISSDKIRTRVAKFCEQSGLYRVQKSVFLGEMEPSRIDELAERSREEIDEDHDRVYIFPMCEKDFQRVKTIGQAFDEELVTDDIRSLIL
jgi:CRISPR-associated protein Cas2